MTGRPAGFTARTPLRLPTHRDSSATIAGAYPFLAAHPPQAGIPVGIETLTGMPFCFDPWTLYQAGRLTNPNMLLAGVIGQGKSALAKSLAVRSIAAGRRVYVLGDPKGEWVGVAHAVGGYVLSLGPGMPDRLNPLDAAAAGSPQATRSVRLQLLAALAQTTLNRDLRPVEHTLIDAALTQASDQPAVLTLPDLLLALESPNESAIDQLRLNHGEHERESRDLAHALRRVVSGDLAGMFDGPSTVVLDPASPMVVLDLSRLGAHDQALTLAMACGSAWLESALVAGSGKRWIIYDEAWRILSSLPLLRRMQSQWKLSRAHGIANLMVLHRLSDLDSAGATGSEIRAVAEGLLADCSTRVIYRQESDQIGATAATLGLTAPERAILPALPRGTGLWKLPGSAHVVRHILHEQELRAFDTDAAMREGGRPSNVTALGGRR